MSELRLHLHPDPILRQVCASVDTSDARIGDLAKQMLQMMYDAPGRGLAGPQVGVAKRVFVMDATWKEGVPAPLVMVNPVVVWASDDTELGEEGCLSIPDTPCKVRRSVAVTMTWQDADGIARKGAFEGVAARIALHELDHLDGVLCIDRVEAA